jgi:DNA mismatch repair protein PMS2
MQSATGWNINGLVSSAVGGRRSKDVQLFYVNRRPIDPPKRIAKLINDTYHQYNSYMYPVAILSFTASQGLVDVNVTPDKRTVFLHNEEVLLADIQQKLTELYAAADKGPGVSLANFGIGRRKSDAAPGTAVSAVPLTFEPAPFVDSSSKLEAATTPKLAQSAPPFTDFDTPEKAISVTPEPLPLPEASGSSQLSASQLSASQLTANQLTASPLKRPANGSCPTWARPLKRRPTDASEADDANSVGSQPPIDLEECAEFTLTTLTPSQEPAHNFCVTEIKRDDSVLSMPSMAVAPCNIPGVTLVEVVEPPKAESPVAQETGNWGISEFVDGAESGNISGVSVLQITSEDAVPAAGTGEVFSTMESVKGGNAVRTTTKRSTGLVEEAWPPPPPLRVATSMAQLEAALSKTRARLEKYGTAVTAQPTQVSFPTAFSLSSLRGGGTEQASSLEDVATFATAEGSKQSAALQFDQSFFQKMRVIGQFNRGFIIAALRTISRDKGDDGVDGLQLFIVDQHASDEKFRFEALNRDSKVDRQPLVSAHHLQLTPAQEQMAEANLEVFRMNGFDFRKDDTRAPGRRLRLLSLPSCQGLVFNERDIHDLLHTIEQAEIDGGQLTVKKDSPQGLLDLAGHRGSWTSTGVPRPHKVWQLLACRACRGAIMIGKALRVSEMEKVLRNLGTLRQPWNCPHGRPTMRHLVDAGSAWRAQHPVRPLTMLLAKEVVADSSAGHNA